MAVLASDQQIVSTVRPAAAAAGGLGLYGGRALTYAQLWRTQPAVRTVSDFLARNVAQLGLKVYRRVGDDDRRHLPDHPFARTLAAPNPVRSKYAWINALVHDLAIYDVAFHAKVRAADGRVALLRLPPSRTTPVGDNYFMPEAFEIAGKGKVRIPAASVVHFHGYDPEDDRAGVSPIETLRRTLAEDDAASEHLERLWRRGARMSGWIERPQRPVQQEWSAPARERFKEGWRDAYTGEGEQTGGTPILEDGMQFHESSFSPRDAQYLEARKLTREEVAAAYHVPPPMVGILDHATFSNITEQHKQLYSDTLGPWLVWIEQELQRQVLPDCGDADAVYCEFNLAEKLRGSFEEQARSIQTLVGRPVLTADEGRALLNRPAMGGDAAELITPLNVLVGGQASPTDSAADEADVDDVGGGADVVQLRR